MLSIETFKRMVKYKSENIDPETGEEYQRKLDIKPEQIELQKVYETKGNWHYKVLVNSDKKFHE